MNLDAGIGICGSTLLFYDRVKDGARSVQACGGSRYNPWTSRGGHIAAGYDQEHLPTQAWVEHRLRYIVGASMLVSRRFVESVGLMNEQYFLYFEEIDWATRARGLFRLGYAPLSLVFHKTGATIGTAARPIFQSEMADYWGTRNRIVFTRKYFLYALPSVYFFVLCSALLRLVNGRIANFRAVVAGALLLSAPALTDIPPKATERGIAGD
jgi:GT2 family glycosyltransferase